MSAKITGYVLAGGASTRFGKDKALAEFSGKPMLVRMIELMQSATKLVKIVGPLEKYADFRMDMVKDRWPGEGPLGGIITALLDAANLRARPELGHESRLTRQESLGWCLIVSCDMPFLTREWLLYLSERAAKSNAQAVLPVSVHGAEPLCACYREDAAGALRAAFDRGVRKIIDALEEVKTEVLDEADWKRFDNRGRLFWNMNTAADFEEVRRVWQAERE
jgi:molybdopterin-guanine dinucleotide biosynthesis protein A